MTVSEFNKLTLEKKADFVLEWGYFIGRKKQQETNTVVYYLGNFMAEVSYLLCETSKVEVLKKVELKKYMSHFDYKNLFFIKTLTGIQSNIPS
jgi:hypothetical protein